MIFDRERYEQESKEPENIAAENVFADGDYDMASTLWRRAYRNGNSLAAVKLGILYYRGYGVKQNGKMAAELFEKGMEEGNPLGADWLAKCFKDGRSLPVDIRKAQLLVNESFDALEEMAQAGDAYALYSCGYRYKHWDGVTSNTRKAYEYLGKAAEAQLLDAVAELAEMCIEGPWMSGTGYNLEKAEKLLLRYQDRADCRIHALLGYAYFDAENGFGYRPEKALQHLLTAAEMDDVPSQRRAGIYYLGVHPYTEKDYDEAVKWLDLAADNGDEEALEYLERLYSHEDYWDFERQDEDEAQEYAWYRSSIQCYTKLCQDLRNFIDKFSREVREDPSVELTQIEQSLVDFAYAVFNVDEDEEDLPGLQEAFEAFCRTFAEVEGVSRREEIRYARFLTDFGKAFPEIDIEGVLVLLERAEEKSSLPYIACLLGLLNKGMPDDPRSEAAAQWYETAWDKAARLRENAWSSDFGEYLPPAQGGFEDACLDDDVSRWEFGDADYRDPDDDDSDAPNEDNVQDEGNVSDDGDTRDDSDASGDGNMQDQGDASGDGNVQGEDAAHDNGDSSGKKGARAWKNLSEEAKSCLITENTVCGFLIECYEILGNRRGRFDVLRTLAPNWNWHGRNWCEKLAACYEKGDGTVRDFDEAMRWYAAAENGSWEDLAYEYRKNLSERKDRSAVRLWNKLTDRCAALVQTLEENGAVTETDRAALALAKAVPEHGWEEPFSEFVRIFIEGDGDSGYEEIRSGRFLNGFTGAIRRYGNFLGGFVEVVCRNDVREDLTLLEGEAAGRKTPYLFSLLGNLYESDIPCKSLMKAKKCYLAASERLQALEKDFPGGGEKLKVLEKDIPGGGESPCAGCEGLEDLILAGLRRCDLLLAEK